MDHSWANPKEDDAQTRGLLSIILDFCLLLGAASSPSSSPVPYILIVILYCTILSTCIHTYIHTYIHTQYASGSTPTLLKAVDMFLILIYRESLMSDSSHHLSIDHAAFVSTTHLHRPANHIPLPRFVHVGPRRCAPPGQGWLGANIRTLRRIIEEKTQPHAQKKSVHHTTTMGG